MADAGGPDEDRSPELATREHERARELLPEEAAAGSADPEAQAGVLLEESDEREDVPGSAPDTFVEHRTSEQSAD